MYSRLSADDVKKRHLSQEWRQVSRSDGDKEGLYSSVLSFFSSRYERMIGRNIRV